MKVPYETMNAEFDVLLISFLENFYSLFEFKIHDEDDDK